MHKPHLAKNSTTIETGVRESVWFGDSAILCVTPCISLWLCATLPDSAWLYVTLCDSALLCVTLSLHVTLCDTVSLCTTLCYSALLCSILSQGVLCLIVLYTRSQIGPLCHVRRFGCYTCPVLNGPAQNKLPKNLRNELLALSLPFLRKHMKTIMFNHGFILVDRECIWLICLEAMLWKFEITTSTHWK